MSFARAVLSSDPSCLKEAYYYHVVKADGKSIDLKVELENFVRLSDLLKNQTGETLSFRDMTRDVLIDGDVCKKAIDIAARRIVALPGIAVRAPYMNVETANGCYFFCSMFYNEMGGTRANGSFTYQQLPISGISCSTGPDFNFSKEWHAAIKEAREKAGLVFDKTLKVKSRGDEVIDLTKRLLSSLDFGAS